MHAKSLYKDKIAMSRTFSNFSRIFHFYSQICFPDLEKESCFAGFSACGGSFLRHHPFPPQCDNYFFPAEEKKPSFPLQQKGWLLF